MAEAHIVELAAHGKDHALAQGLLSTDPPAVHPSWRGEGELASFTLLHFVTWTRRGSTDIPTSRSERYLRPKGGTQHPSMLEPKALT